MHISQIRDIESLISMIDASHTILYVSHVIFTQLCFDFYVFLYNLYYSGGGYAAAVSRTFINLSDW